METRRIYLDYAATTPLDRRVLRKMLPFFIEDFGNPSSIHYFGQVAENAISTARMKVAGLLNVSDDELVFTASATESNNLALRGVALAMKKTRGANLILTTPVEHHAVLHTVQQLAREFGFKVVYLPVDQHGLVDPRDMQKAISPEVAIVSVIAANNEIGTINPISELGAICQKAGIPFHTDAVQAAAHMSLDVKKDHIDLLTIGAHKFYGPKGAGLLYISRDIPYLSVMTGGGQETGRRAGTHNVPLIIALAEAYQITQTELTKWSSELTTLRDDLIGRVLKGIPGAFLTGHPEKRLPNHASFVFEGVNGNNLLVMLDMAGFACSSGSACKTGNPKPSEVLIALGISPELALGSLRITLGRQSTQAHINALMDVLPGMVQKARSLTRQT